jgi:hypothetical protein
MMAKKSIKIAEYLNFSTIFYVFQILNFGIRTGEMSVGILEYWV